MKLSESIARAHKARLCDGKYFTFAPDVKEPLQLRSMVVTAGGIVTSFKEHDQDDSVQLVVETVNSKYNVRDLFTNC